MAKLKPILTLISVLIISLAVGYVLAAWQEPGQAPPGGNVYAPINVSPESQVKEGSPGTIAAGGFLGQVPGYGIYPDPGGASTIGSSLTITGSASYLKLPLLTAAQRDALTPATGMMIYNTTANEVQVYVPSEWKKLMGGTPIGATCTLPTECETGFCVDGRCCDTACDTQTCQTCGLYSAAGAGFCGWVIGGQDPKNECTTATPPNAGSCKSTYCSGTGNTCGYLTNGEQSQPVCKRCSGSSYDPVFVTQNTRDTEGTNLCNATCVKCSSGNCVNQTSTEDLFNQCAQGSTASDGCSLNNCSGTSAACGYYSDNAEHGCPTACTTCNGATSGACVNMADNTQDTQGSYTCSGTCKKCSGGSCLNQNNGEDIFAHCGGLSCCGYCDGSGVCANKGSGTTCSSPGNACTATHYRCNGAGACTAPCSTSYAYTSGGCYGDTCGCGGYCAEVQVVCECDSGSLSTSGGCTDYDCESFGYGSCDYSTCTCAPWNYD